MQDWSKNLVMKVWPRDLVMKVWSRDLAMKVYPVNNFRHCFLPYIP